MRSVLRKLLALTTALLVALILTACPPERETQRTEPVETIEEGAEEAKEEVEEGAEETKEEVKDE